MPQPEQYRRISERYAQAAELTNRNVPEASGFEAYHAFESIGAAWIRHCGQTVPRHHKTKLTHFVRLCRGRRFGRGAAVLAQALNGLRNRMLYPIPDANGNFELPENHISTQDAQDMVRRVRGLIRHVEADL